MRRLLTLDWRTLVFAAAIAGALGFGANEAFASAPRETAKEACSSICSPECGSFGGSYISGRCYCCG